jgi:hypothetical protein
MVRGALFARVSNHEVCANILIFDACRNNPLQPQVASAGPNRAIEADRDWRRRGRWAQAQRLARGR